MSTPGMNRANGTMKTDRRTGREESLTVENRADKDSGKPSLLVMVDGGCNLWRIRTIGPPLFLRVRHGPDAKERGGSRWRWERSCGGGVSGAEKGPAMVFDGRGVTGDNKISGKVN